MPEDVVLSTIVPNGYFAVCREIEECDLNLSEVILYKETAHLCGYADAIVGSKVELCNSDLLVYNLYEKKCRDGMFSIGQRIGSRHVRAPREHGCISDPWQGRRSVRNSRGDNWRC